MRLMNRGTASAWHRQNAYSPVDPPARLVDLRNEQIALPYVLLAWIKYVFVVIMNVWWERIVDCLRLISRELFCKWRSSC